ncbi:cation transporter [candidate division WOR-3 bacterium]|nr:cation transporter [candidate division WOR-3 bacterium]
MKHTQKKYKHFNDLNDLHRTRDRLKGPIKLLLFDLKNQPMTRIELKGVLTSFMPHAYKTSGPRDRDRGEKILTESLEYGFDNGVIEEKGGLIHLTHKGRELTEHMEEVIPWFFDKFFSTRTVTKVNMIIHVVLSVIKLGAAVLSGSAGLLADGIDNGGDTLSSVLVWLGIRHRKERSTSIFIVAMMYVSAGGVIWATISKIINPEPLTGGWVVFSISAIAGFVMLVMSFYEYAVGKRKRNFALICQSIDARNHFWTSLMVCVGIVLSFFAEKFSIPWLLYGDVMASGIIGVLIIKSAVELTIELAKPAGKQSLETHFMERASRKAKDKFVKGWLVDELAKGPSSQAELEERYCKQFYRRPPRFVTLSGWEDSMWRSEELKHYLDRFADKGVIVKSGNIYKQKAAKKS